LRIRDAHPNHNGADLAVRRLFSIPFEGCLNLFLPIPLPVESYPFPALSPPNRQQSTLDLEIQPI